MPLRSRKINAAKLFMYSLSTMLVKNYCAIIHTETFRHSHIDFNYFFPKYFILGDTHPPSQYVNQSPRAQFLIG